MFRRGFLVALVPLTPFDRNREAVAMAIGIKDAPCINVWDLQIVEWNGGRDPQIKADKFIESIYINNDKQNKAWSFNKSQMV